MTLPTVPFGPYQISRLICGSNPFLGYSYRSAAHNRWQRKHFTPERIAEILEKCAEHGINTLVGNMDDERTLPRALEVMEQRTGERLHWIAYTHGGPDGQEESISMIADAGAIACYIQGGVVDSRFQYNFVGAIQLDQPNQLEQIRGWIDRIQEKGMIPGAGTHRAQILEIIDRGEYGNDFFVHPVNYLGAYCSYAETVRAVRRTERTVIASKTLGGSAKIRPQDGFTCAYTALKPRDIVAVGMEHEEAVEENAQLAADILKYA